jgi:hypothetical protein
MHLRGGLLPLARAALEQMAGAGTLDREALADLAEVRWRSGDLEGAAEAARAHHAAGGAEPVAYLIIADHLLRHGQQADGLRLAGEVAARVGGALDVLFAGESRGPGWPPATPEWMDRGAGSPGRWGILVGGAEVAAPTPDTWAPIPIARHGLAPAGGPRPGAPAGMGPFGAAPIVRPGAPMSTAAVLLSGRAAGDELEAAEHAIAEGHPAGAAGRLALLLRADPALAPVILSLVDRALAGPPPAPEAAASLLLVRGDAFRVLGRDIEAQTAFQQAHQALSPGPPAKESP